MSEKNLFEIASRNRYRFATNRGNVTTEDLWDLSLEDLDASYKGYAAQLKTATEDSLLTPATENTEAENKRDLLVFVVRTKQADAEKRTQAKLRRQQAARVRELIANTHDEALAGKSAEELHGLLAALEA